MMRTATSGSNGWATRQSSWRRACLTRRRRRAAARGRVRMAGATPPEGDPGSRRVDVALAAHCGCWPCRDAGRVRHPGLARVHGGTERRPARPLCTVRLGPGTGTGRAGLAVARHRIGRCRAGRQRSRRGAVRGLGVRARRRSGRSSRRDACHLSARVKVGYEYDFRASWQHEITWQKAFMLNPGQL